MADMLIIAPLHEVRRLLDERPEAWICGLLGPGMAHPPLPVPPHRRLRLSFHDTPRSRPGHTTVSTRDIARLLAFARRWHRARDGAVAGAPLVLHCWMGISRSPAAAFIVHCALRPRENEMTLARQLRALAPCATPNPRMVALADALLGRQGRMRAAIAMLGRGRSAPRGAIMRWPVPPPRRGPLLRKRPRRAAPPACPARRSRPSTRP